MTPDDIRQEIELKVVEMLKDKVAEGVLSEDRSQQIAKHVLDTLKPGMSLTELFRVIPRLDDNCPELSPVILPYLKRYEEDVVKNTREGVRNLIRQGQFDAATKLAEQAISQTVKVVWQGSAKAG